MFKSPLDALFIMYGYTNNTLDITERKTISVGETFDEHIISISYNLDIKIDLENIFNKLNSTDKNILLLYAEYNNKSKVAQLMEMPYTTFCRKLHQALNKWGKLLKNGGYIK